ncbi:MAG: hypothetical protein RL375_4137, partial [Pseudomonadota bacterium]
YGSVQAPGKPSITQIEFECALERWKHVQPPAIAVMMPALDSAVDIELKRRAADIVATRQLDQAEHAERIDGFRQRVTGSWRKVNFFNDAQELREHSIVVCATWIHGGFAAAARAHQPAAQVDAMALDEADLGMLGRATQIDALKSALGRLKVSPHPALAVLVHGNDEAGQRSFLAHLVKKPLRAFRPEGRTMRLPQAGLALPALCAWVAQSLGVVCQGDQTPANVADAVAGKLRERPMCLMLDGVGAFDGGAAAFHARFWRPFFERLVQWHEAQAFAHRLVAVLSEYSGQPETWAAVARQPADKDATGALLLALPELGPYEEDDVATWLGDMNFADDPPGSLAEVQARAVTNDRGEPDLNPMKVLARLRFETLVPLEDDE